MPQSYPTFVYLDSAIEEKGCQKPWHLNPLQRAALRNAFEKDPYPSIQTSIFLLRELGISRRASSNWFSRQRARVRKGKLKKPEKTLQCKHAYTPCVYVILNRYSLSLSVHSYSPRSEIRSNEKKQRKKAEKTLQCKHAYMPCV